MMFEARLRNVAWIAARIHTQAASVDLPGRVPLWTREAIDKLIAHPRIVVVRDVAKNPPRKPVNPGGGKNAAHSRQWQAIAKNSRCAQSLFLRDLAYLFGGKHIHLVFWRVHEPGDVVIHTVDSAHWMIGVRALQN